MRPAAARVEVVDVGAHDARPVAGPDPVRSPPWMCTESTTPALLIPEPWVYPEAGPISVWVTVNARPPGSALMQLSLEHMTRLLRTTSLAPRISSWPGTS